MNKFFKTIVLTIFSFFVFVGCSGKEPILRTPTNVKIEDNFLIVSQRMNPFNNEFENEVEDKNERFIASASIGLDVVLKKIAEETLKLGHTHFVIVNKSINAFQGFSINNKKDLVEFCMADYYTDKELNGKCGQVIDWNLVEIKALPGSNFHYTVASWDAKKVLEEINSSSSK